MTDLDDAVKKAGDDRWHFENLCFMGSEEMFLTWAAELKSKSATFFS